MSSSNLGHRTSLDGFSSGSRARTKGRLSHLVKIRVCRLFVEERVWKTGGSWGSTRLGCVYLEMASLWAVERIGGGREWRIWRSIVYKSVTQVSTRTLPLGPLSRTNLFVRSKLRFTMVMWERFLGLVDSSGKQFKSGDLSQLKLSFRINDAPVGMQRRFKRTEGGVSAVIMRDLR